jgi:UDP-N-acetylglucosamine 4,6-dehydratase
MNTLNLLNRKNPLFSTDIENNASELSQIVSSSRFLVIGGAGSIGQAVVKELFSRSPKVLHVIDLSENNCVELVRDIRSTLGYIDGEFKVLPLDSASTEYDAFIKSSCQYDYIFNLSALKHVRSEKDPYTLMRLINVNIMSNNKIIKQGIEGQSKKYFCVSTDKAANPVNMMGASKRIMELFLMEYSKSIDISTARFANVAFSDGSLLHGFKLRLDKGQPLSAPADVKRYFVTFKEAGELCLLSCLLGENKDIFFPKLSTEINLTTFKDIAIKFLDARGFTAYNCDSEQEARDRATELIKKKQWPCYFFESDTTGEKPFEEFFTTGDKLENDRFKEIGIIKNNYKTDKINLEQFESTIYDCLKRGTWNKEELVQLFQKMIPSFNHYETNKYLDGRM